MEDVNAARRATRAAPLTDEGYVTIDKAGRPADSGYKIHYRVFGDATETLIGLHGGPGVSSRYLDRLAEVVGGSRKLVLYDQLGGGKSDRPEDPALWRIARFVQELETVRSGLNLGTVHLFGQSWGGALALHYALEYPQNVTGLILSTRSRAALSTSSRSHGTASTSVRSCMP